MAGKFKVRPIAGHEPVPRFIDPDDSSILHFIGLGMRSHWSKSLLVSPDSVPRFSHHFLALIVGIFPEQKMDITLGHDCQFVNCKNKICLCLIRF